MKNSEVKFKVKITKKLYFVLLGVLMASGIVLAINTLTTGYKISASSQKIILEHSKKYQWTNNCAKAAFIPTKTASEYTSAINKSPSCLSPVLGCTTKSDCGSNQYCSGYVSGGCTLHNWVIIPDAAECQNGEIILTLTKEFPEEIYVNGGWQLVGLGQSCNVFDEGRTYEGRYSECSSYGSEAIGACHTYSNCSLDGVTVNHGSSRYFFNARESTGNCSYIDYNRSCNNGVLSGSSSYRYASCASYQQCEPDPCFIGEMWDPDLCECVPDGGSCFTEITSVQMGDGSYKEISTIEIGEFVQGETQLNEVLGMEIHDFVGRELFSINGGEFFVTSEHPFKTTEGWKAIDPLWLKEEDRNLYDRLNPEVLMVGDVLLTENGEDVIESLTSKLITEEIKVYNLMLNGDNTYYADGYLVHNRKLEPMEL